MMFVLMEQCGHDEGMGNKSNKETKLFAKKIFLCKNNPNI